MKKGLIEVKAVVEAAETVMVRMSAGLVFVHLPVAVKVGPSLLVGQNLKGVTGNGGCAHFSVLLWKWMQQDTLVLVTHNI